MTNTIDINGLSYMRVGDITVAIATTSVSFTGLDIGKDDDYILVSDIVGTSATYGLYINGNTTNTNYYIQELYANGTSVTSGKYNVPYLCSMESNQKVLSIAKLKLTNSGYFCYQSNCSMSYSSTLIKEDIIYGTSTFTSLSITSLAITSSVASSIGVGSRFQLYKLVADKVADIIVGAVCTSVDMSGLNIGKDNEYMLVSTVVGAGTTNLAVYINDITTRTQYYRQQITAIGTTVTALRDNYSDFSAIYTGGLSTCFYSNIKVTNSGYFIWETSSSAKVGNSLMELMKTVNTSLFTLTNITKLTIGGFGTNYIGVGSRFTLYKLR